jgi:antitoxin MazE
MNALVKLSKWGNGYGLRVSKKLMDAMDGEPGKPVELVVLGKRKAGIRKLDENAEFLRRLRALQKRGPKGFRFNRSEANER